MKKDKQDIGTYHMGKHTGYHLVDGEYYIANCYQDEFEQLDNAAEGIDLMLKIVTKHATEDLTAIKKASKNLWGRIVDDIGIDIRQGGWTYSNGIIRSAKPKTEEEVKHETT